MLMCFTSKTDLSWEGLLTNLEKNVFSYTLDGIPYAEVMFLYAIRKKFP